MQNLQEPFAPARAVQGKLAFASDMALPLERPSNQDDAANCLAALLCRTTTLTSASQYADLLLVRPMARVICIALAMFAFVAASPGATEITVTAPDSAYLAQVDKVLIPALA